MTRTGSDWWRHAVIYQIYPRSFLDSNGDGVGDLRGVLQRLDYIAALGVDAVWLSPFFRSPMKDFGYDISDYCDVDPVFGTLDDARALIDACHTRGIRVIIDQVWNHTSDQHPWFRESRQSRDNPKANWYVWADPAPDGTAPNNWLSTFGGSAWTFDAQRDQYYLHNFLREQPDLNWYEPEVVDAVLAAARFWLDAGVDGFRLDVINFLTHDRCLRNNPLRSSETPRPAGASEGDPFFNQVNLHNLCQDDTLRLLPAIRKLMDEYPGTTTLAEISCAEDTLATSAEYVRGTNRLHMAYNSSLMTDEPLTAGRVGGLIDRVESLFSDGVICWTGGTHDFPRLTSRWRRFHPPEPFLHDAFEHLFAALIIALRGSCCIYQGDELGLTQADIPRGLMQDPFGIQGYPNVLGRDGSRTPLPWSEAVPNHGFTSGEAPWLPIPGEHAARAVDRQERDPASLLNKYRRLIHWRRRQPALLRGDQRRVRLPGELLGFTRSCDEQTLLCVFNMGPETTYLSLDDFPRCRPVSDELDFIDRSYGNTIELPPFGVFFAELETPTA